MTPIEGVPADRLELYWPVVRDWIADAVVEAANCWTADDVLRDLRARKMQLWVVWGEAEPVGALVTEIYDTAAGKTCAIPIVGGDGILERLDALAIIEMWAKQAGCVRLRGEGRAGWERSLRPYGWRKLTTVVEKALA